MKLRVVLFYISAISLLACSQTAPEAAGQGVKGQWLLEADGSSMLDPQTSGLVFWRGRLLSVSDASADSSQRMQLHQFNPQTAAIAPESFAIRLSEAVTRSCFAEYLGGEPDYEALVVDPDDDKVFYLVTEDATRGAGLSSQCKQKYPDTGSTDYPTVLVRLALQSDDSLVATHARPLQFSASSKVGNYPNDGIEGMAFGLNRTLYLGLEKDDQVKARIFSVQMDDSFWSTDEFAPLIDPELNMPSFESGNHPINGMDYYPVENHPGFLIVAARNDSQIWIIDISKALPARVIQHHYLVPTGSSGGECDEWEVMDNASIEGLAVAGQTLYMVNDPWRRNYTKNIQCETNRSAYERMAPLLFSVPIDKQWFD